GHLRLPAELAKRELVGGGIGDDAGRASGGRVEDRLGQREDEKRRGGGRIGHAQPKERRSAALGSHRPRRNDLADEADAAERADSLILPQRTAGLGERIERAVRPVAAEARLQALVRASDGIAGPLVASEAGGL